MRKYVLGFFGLLFLIVLLTFGYESRKIDRSLQISPETTRILGPVLEDGRIDYVAAANEIASEGVTLEENAMVLYAQALGPNLESVSPKYQHEYFQLLGIPQPPADGDYFQPIPQFCQAYYLKNADPDDEHQDNLSDRYLDDQRRVIEGGKDLEQALHRPWSAEEFPLIGAWVAANEKPLELFVAGSKRPKYYSPLATAGDKPVMIAILLPTVQSMRGVARALVARAMLRIEAGEIETALEDLHACHRLARHVAGGSTLMEALVGYGIDHMAFEAERSVASRIALSPEQSREYQARINDLPAFPTMAERIDDFERLMFLDIVGVLSREGTHMVRHLLGAQTTTESMAEELFSFAADNFVDWNKVLRTGNSWYDRVVEAGKAPTFSQRDAAIKELANEVDALATRSKSPGQAFKSILTGRSISSTATDHVTGVLISLFIPSVRDVFIAEERSRQQASLTQAAFALAAHKTMHGDYPESLDELTPEFIATVPLDSFSGQQLVYKHTSDGYVLYSVGPNLKDDDGATQMPGLSCDDITFRMPFQPSSRE